MTSVYIIGAVNAAGVVDRVKIGIAGSPRGRLSNLQSGCPDKLVLVHSFEAPTRTIARALEVAFHRTQKKRRIHGEWFSYTGKQALYLMYLNLATHLNVVAEMAPHEVDDAVSLIMGRLPWQAEAA